MSVDINQSLPTATVIHCVECHRSEPLPWADREAHLVDITPAEGWEIANGAVCPCCAAGKHPIIAELRAEIEEAAELLAHAQAGFNREVYVNRFEDTEAFLARHPLHRPIGFDGHRALDCQVCGERWPCRTSLSCHQGPGEMQ